MKTVRSFANEEEEAEVYTCIVAILEFHDEAMGICLLCGLHHHLEGHGRQAVGDVVCDGACEQHWLLAHQGDLRRRKDGL